MERISSVSRVITRLFLGGTKKPLLKGQSPIKNSPVAKGKPQVVKWKPPSPLTMKEVLAKVGQEMTKVRKAFGKGRQEGTKAGNAVADRLLGKAGVKKTRKTPKGQKGKVDNSAQIASLSALLSTINPSKLAEILALSTDAAKLTALTSAIAAGEGVEAKAPEYQKAENSFNKLRAKSQTNPASGFLGALASSASNMLSRIPL